MFNTEDEVLVEEGTGYKETSMGVLVAVKVVVNGIFVPGALQATE
jgi:hypothetical protein